MSNGGPKTTEFWLVMAGIASVVLNGTEFINIPWDQFHLIMGLIGAYTGSRAWVKASEAKAKE